jgi:hypothetical protein
LIQLTAQARIFFVSLPQPGIFFARKGYGP